MTPRILGIGRRRDDPERGGAGLQHLWGRAGDIGDARPAQCRFDRQGRRSNFDNITAISGVGPIACVVTGMPGHSICNVRFRHLKFVTVGGIEKIATGGPGILGRLP